MEEDKKMKKVLLTVLLMGVGAGWISAVEVGVNAGYMSNTPGSGWCYGFSGSTGLIIPMVKLELEWYKQSQSDTSPVLSDKGICLGVKLRPQWGSLAPYGIIGLGWEFGTLGFDFDEYTSFTFFGGGVHLYLSRMISLRGDLRFMSFSSFSRVKVSAGLFFHL